MIQDLAWHFDNADPGLIVLNEDGVNMANTEVRLTAIGYVYVDNVDGYELISESEFLWLGGVI